MKRTIFFVLLVLCSSKVISQNLITNPGMENWESASKPAGWSVAEGCATEGSVINSGSFSCLQTGGTTTSKDLNQNIAVVPGKDYSFSVYFRTGAATTGNGGRIWCKWLNGGVDVTDEASKAIMQTPYLKSASWQQYSFTVKAPPTATTFLLQVRTLPNSITYWDDFIFQEGVATGIAEDYLNRTVLYPVPAGDYMNIKASSGVKSFEILDLSGTLLKSAPGESELSIYVGDLAKGFYILRLKYHERVELRKFMKD